MTSARKAALLRFLLWSLYSFVLLEIPDKFSLPQVLFILALFEVIIATSPFLDEEKLKSQKDETPLDKK